jgi:hypothetical protein
MSLVRQARGGRDNDPVFGRRMRGTGEFAELIARRFELTERRLQLDAPDRGFNTSLFRPPAAPASQLDLFD